MEIVDRDHLLVLASERIIASHSLDSTARLALQNMRIGVARLLHTIRTLDPQGDVRFTASVDFTITRSPNRWGSGFAYGGYLEIFTENPLVAPDVRPNTCGVLVAALRETPTVEEMIRRVEAVSASSATGTWDYSRRNHFLNVYRSEASGASVVLLHGCPDWLRKDSEEHHGLYPEASLYWKSRMRVVKSPLGTTGVLVDEDAREYWENYKACEEISKADRRRVITEAFGDFEEISNETHEGMLDLGSYVLGCHRACDPRRSFPLMSTFGEPAYLVSAPDAAAGPVLLPHGTGYRIALADALSDVCCLENGSVLYRFRDEAGCTHALRDFGNVPYDYRDAELIARWVREGRLVIRDTLMPVLACKL